APNLFRFDSNVDHIAVGPDEGVKRFHFGRCRSILLAAVDLDGAGLAQLNGHDSRRRVGPEENFVLFEFHIERFRDSRGMTNCRAAHLSPRSGTKALRLPSGGNRGGCPTMATAAIDAS